MGARRFLQEEGAIPHESNPMSLVLAVLTLLAPPSAADPVWYRIGGDEDMVVYVEAATIRVEGGITTAMTMTANAGPSDSGAQNTIVAVAFDCAAGRFRDMLYNFLDADGNVLRKEESRMGPEFRTPKPGGYNDLLMRFACRREGGTRVGNPLDDADEWFSR